MSFDILAEQPDLSNDSMDSDLAALAPPGDEDLLRTSPPGEQSGAQAAPNVPLPGGAQGAGSSQAQTQGIAGRRSPIHLMPQDELMRVEHECKKYNQAAASLMNMLTKATNTLKTRFTTLNKPIPTATSSLPYSRP